LFENKPFGNPVNNWDLRMPHFFTFPDLKQKSTGWGTWYVAAAEFSAEYQDPMMPTML
jgi:hypothetical protein